MWIWTSYNNELYHHGIPGMKHGVRRFQFPDGSLTPAGRKRYGVGLSRDSDQYIREYDRYVNHPKIAKAYSRHYNPEANKTVSDYSVALHDARNMDDKYRKLVTKVKNKGYSHTGFLKLRSDGERLNARAKKIDEKYGKEHKRQYKDYENAKRILNQAGASIYMDVSNFLTKDLKKRYPEASWQEIEQYQNWLVNDILENR